MLLNISQSRIRTWRTCHQQHYYKHVENLRKRVPSRPLQFGRIIHSMLEAYAEGDDPFDKLEDIELENHKLFNAEVEMYGRLIKDISDIMTEYFNYWPKKSIRFLKRKGKAAEHRFELEIEKGLNVVGVIDAVGQTDNNLTWLVENKSFGKEPNPDELWRNLQSSVYIRMIEMMGWWPKAAIDGVLWNFIASKPPTVPQILKNGSVSERKITTLPLVLDEFFEEQGLTRNDYPELYQQAVDSRKSYFFRRHTPVSNDVVDNIFQDFIVTAREIADKGEKTRDRNIGRHCSWCDYESICRAALTGGDVDYTIERGYYHGDTKGKEKESKKRKGKSSNKGNKKLACRQSK